jgi:Raf kinase inhibitor-like YbhB/YbcL family protein
MYVETDFYNNEDIPKKHGCEGSGTSPPFEINDLQENIKSLAITIVDADADNFVNWVIYNIPASGKDLLIEENTKLGIQGKNGKGERGYSPLCADSSKHQFIVTIYALDSLLLLDVGEKKDLENAMEGHLVESQIIKGYYECGKEKGLTSETQILS